MKFKKGDWVFIKKAESENYAVYNGRIVPILRVRKYNTTGNTGYELPLSVPGNEWVQGTRTIWYKKELRLATPEEIEKGKLIEIARRL